MPGSTFRFLFKHQGTALHDKVMMYAKIPWGSKKPVEDIKQELAKAFGIPTSSFEIWGRTRDGKTDWQLYKDGEWQYYQNVLQFVPTSANEAQYTVGVLIKQQQPKDNAIHILTNTYFQPSTLALDPTMMQKLAKTLCCQSV